MTTASASPHRRRPVLLGLAGAVVLVLLWWSTHPARPHQAASDLFTHLSVARHLARGEGFRTDIAYPLSFAWEFARELPQPLIHRPPGFALLLAVPCAALQGQPEPILDAVRLLQLAILGGIAWLGTTAWLARGRPGAAVGWLLLLGTNPLLAYAVDWGHVELGAGLLLLMCWLRRRDGPRPPTAGDGLLLGGLALLRPELVPLPLLWWLLAARDPFPPWRSLVVPAVAFLVVTAPWAVRNAALTGDPFFSVQSQAEHVKDTRAWPGYSVYLQLEPQPLLRTLRDDPEPVLRKTARGLRFFGREAHGLAPWPLVAAALVGTLALAGSRLRRRRSPVPADGAATALVSLGLAGATLVLLAVLYAVFDHSLRHLGVAVPLLLWEGAGLASFLVAGLDRVRRRPHRDREQAAFAIVLAVLLVLLVDARPAGWEQALAEARRAETAVATETARLLAAPAGLCFTTSAAAPWFADRAAVWDPGDPALRHRLELLLTAHGQAE